MKRTLVRTLAASVAALPGAAFALGLGPIQVNSAFDQPLDAKIPIIAARPGEIDQLSASIPGRALFERMGMEPTPVLNQLTFTVEGLDGRQPYIQVRSRGSVREPLLDILVEVSWASGRILRDYSIFLDPPNVARRAKASRQSRTAQAPQRSTAPVRASNPPSTPRFSGDRYQVGQGETLYSIANQTRPDGSVSTNQMMIALFEANPDAFFAPNIDSLNAGADLRVPSRDEVAAISESQALAAIREQSTAVAATSPSADASVTAAAATRDTPEASVSEAGSETPASTPETVAEAASEPMVRLVQSTEGGAEVPGVEGSGSGSGEAASQTEGTSAFTMGSGEALIRLEDNGMGLRLVGMDGLSSRLPALIALQDSSLAVGAVRPVTDDSAVQATPESAMVDTDAGEIADAGENPEFAGEVTPVSSEMDAVPESTVTAETLESGAEQMADTAAQVVDSGNDGSPLDFDGAAEEATQAMAAALPATDQSSELTSPAEEPVLEENSAAASPAQDAETSTQGLPQVAAAVTEPEAESTPVEEQSAAEVLPKEGLDLWLDRGRNMIAEAKGQIQGLGVASEPRTLAMVGGGLLLLLLLTLLMVRKLFNSAGSQPAAKRAAASPAATNSVPQSMDPMEQATHLIANGEPNRAVSLLRGLMARDSDNARVALTLMSAHLAAGDADGFTHDAETHRSVLELGGVWDEVEEMAQDLCPAHPLFAEHDSVLDEEDHSDSVVDSEFDNDDVFALRDDSEPKQDVEAHSVDTHAGHDEEPVEAQVAETASAPVKQADILEFTPAPRMESEADAEPDQDSPSVADDALEFEFEEYRTASDSDLTEEDLVSAESASELEDVGVALEQEFAKLEAEGLTEILEPELGETDSLLSSLDTEGGEVIDFDAGLDEGLDDEDQSFIETKLDLATAYLEMGDDTGARSLYQEVLEEGNDDQKRLAMTGLQKLG